MSMVTEALGIEETRMGERRTVAGLVNSIEAFLLFLRLVTGCPLGFN
jgi:hypothetical protein